MAKAKRIFTCQACGFETPRWMGNCPGCGDWNTFVEESQSSIGTRITVKKGNNKARSLDEVNVSEETRLVTGLKELDRVLGGGIMQSSLILLAGDPGIGKSTLMTELGKCVPPRRILYVTGEESAKQVKLRAERIGVGAKNFFLLPETDVASIIASAQDLVPEILVIDSIQTLFRTDLSSAPGSVSQVRESAAALLQFTKENPTATFLVGHVTKTGSIAGPRVLEHMVDTVLQFEGDRHHAYRILRATKNRFGSTNEMGLFEMRAEGLRQVENPSEIFLSERNQSQSGSVVVCSMEGTRPLLVEIQALVTDTSYGTPQRTATGFDTRRLQMILAVLEKREGLLLSTQDVFLNVAGGVRLDEPAVDMGVAVAVASSFRDMAVGDETVLIGEVGLGGEIRTVSHIERRLNEVQKLGFRRAVVPKANLAGTKSPKALDVEGVRSMQEVLEICLV